MTSAPPPKERIVSAPGPRECAAPEAAVELVAADAAAQHVVAAAALELDHGTRRRVAELDALIGLAAVKARCGAWQSCCGSARCAARPG